MSVSFYLWYACENVGIKQTERSEKSVFTAIRMPFRIFMNVFVFACSRAAHAHTHPHTSTHAG